VWIILHGRAYDVTQFKQVHPGGPDILFGVAGMDATDDFEDTFHSKNARNLLESKYIGDVEGMQQTDYFSVASLKESQFSTSSTSTLIMVLIPLLIVIAAVIYKFQFSD